MPAISVVIPVYNTEQFIGRCLDSVLSQTFRDLEILCIDDGSTDRTPEILRTYASKDDRIRIITLPENHGVPYARNLAIDEAKGEYLYYMDSDDWLDLDYLEEMYHHAVTSGHDVVINSNWYFDDGVNRLGSGKFRPEYHVKEPTYFPTIQIQTSFFPVVWARLYRLGYLRDNDIRSPQVNGGLDDNFFTSLAEILQPRSYVFSGPFYHYFQRPGSLSRQKGLALNYSHVFRAFHKELKKRGIAPEAAKRFYVAPQVTIDDEMAFNSLRSFFCEVETEVYESLNLYTYRDFITMEMVLDCPDYDTFRSRYPLRQIHRSNVVWETARMTGILDRVPASKLERVAARELLSPFRFDLFTHLFYIKHRLEKPGLCKRVFREADRSYVDKKRSFGEKRVRHALRKDITEFERQIRDMAASPSETFRIPVGRWPVPLDGTHIVAAASYYGRDLSVFKLASADKGKKDYSICLDHAMSRLVADLSAREGVEWIKEPKIICYWSCGKSDRPELVPEGVLYSREFRLGPVSYSRLREAISPGEVGERTRSSVRFVFLSGQDYTVEGSDYQVIENAQEVKRVADLLLTWPGRRKWYHGGGFLCRLAELLENLYDHCSTELGWKYFWTKRKFFILVKKAKGRIRNMNKIFKLA